MSIKVKLTKRAVDAAKPPATPTGFNLVWDSEIPGFGLRVTAAGIKTYILQYRINGRQRKFSIGRHGDKTADQARQDALNLRAKIASGIDPQANRQKEREIPTLDRFAPEYLEHARQTKKTWQKDESLLHLRLLPRWGRMRLDTITRRDIETLHNEVKRDRSPATANRHLALIKRMFNLAMQWGHLDANPAQHIKLLKENNQFTNWLDKSQISAFLAACEADPNPYTGALFPFLLYTGARLGEALAACWDHVDLGRGMWLIPEAKSGKGRYVPLSAPAVELLHQLPRQDESPFVFCGHIKGKPLVNVAKPWKRIRAAADLPENFRIHDLRHTFASWGASNGVDMYHLQTLLGHSSPQMTQRYSHLAEAGIKATVTHISDRMQQARKQPATSQEVTK